MMLAIMNCIRELKWIVPATFMAGTAPVYYGLWLPMRVVTLFLPKKVFHFADDIFYSMYQRLILFFFEHYPGVEVVFYGDYEEIKGKKENVLYICNHQCTIDWAVANMLALRCNSLGQLRYVLKDELKYLPLYGYYFRQHGCVYVKRARKFVPKKTAEQVEQLRGLPFWLVIFPEGTRFNPTKKQVIEKSQKYAESEGLEVFEHVLTPRVKATHMGVNMLKGHIDALYDLTIAYSDSTDSTGKRITAPSMAAIVGGSVSKIHVHVKRIDINEVPTEEKALQQWLHQRFSIKNKMMDQYYRDIKLTGDADLGKDGEHSPLSRWRTLPVALGFAAIFIPMMLTSIGRSLYLKYTVVGTITGIVWMLVRW
ncbi:1-acyl-sn-glycerol-3-phosphate acyltransferase epsilon-like [Tubulanus polymorphus]|uniref:1-acyl-sn-glycerol-3-phosphate acyltransferase epsilon-like n=1 Tax=Tubulanus polymorphus TaxID=672921 RepID=UPI003DA1E7A9